MWSSSVRTLPALLEEGQPERQENFGDASLATTTVYVTTEKRRRMKAVENLWKRYRDLMLVAGVLHRAPPVQPRGLRLPIDLLFSSLARDLGERAVSVVLSGMRSDGRWGLQA